MEVCKRRHLSIFTILAVFIIASLVTYNSGFAQENTTSNEGISDVGNVSHNFYIGGKLGLIYIFGIETNYILKSNDINRVYLAAAIQTSLVVNSINAGGGFFLGKTGVGVGCRYHHLLWFESEKDSKIQPGYGPEVVWNRTIGTKYIINLHAGGIISEGSFFPDISFGVFLPLNK
ncbi:MAG: hypothetical protein MI975_14600 [Cytophagales bacterium]|nr:hypothetical protein [Cytophagales bacterium]